MPDGPLAHDPEGAGAATGTAPWVGVPAVRVARLGVADPFAGAATKDREVATLDELDGSEDLLLVDADTARTHARDLRRLRRGADSPAVIVAGAGRSRRRVGDLVVARHDGACGPGGSRARARRDVLWLPPAIDPSRDNPVGWRRWAGHPAGAVLTAPPPEETVDVLLAEDLEPRLLLGAGLRKAQLPAPLRQLPTARIADVDDLLDRLRRFRVLLDHPAWHAGPAEQEQLLLRAAAVGTPVLTPGDAHRRLGLPAAVTPDVAAAVGADARPDELLDRARRLVADDAERERASVVTRRAVLSHHTGAHRLASVLVALGGRQPAAPRVSVLLATNRPHLLGHAVASVARQDHPDVEVVAILHGDGFGDLDALGRLDGPVRVVRAPAERVLGECLNLGLEEATGDLVAKMDDDDHYGRHHLGDLVLAHGYSGASVVGKRIEHVHLADRDVTVTRELSNVERFRDHVSGPTLLAGAQLLRRHRFSPEPARVDSTLLERVLADGGSVYGTHALDVVLERRGHGHTWEADVEAMLAGAAAVTDGLDLARAASTPDAYDD